MLGSGGSRFASLLSSDFPRRMAILVLASQASGTLAGVPGRNSGEIELEDLLWTIPGTSSKAPNFLRQSLLNSEMRIKIFSQFVSGPN